MVELRQGGSDTSPTSYGEVETVGSTSDSQSKWGRGFRDATEDDDDRPSESLKATQGGVQQDAEEAKQDVDNRFGRFKADIQAATGDLQEDLGQLDVEVQACPCCRTSMHPIRHMSLYAAGAFRTCC